MSSCTFVGSVNESPDCGHPAARLLTRPQRFATRVAIVNAIASLVFAVVLWALGAGPYGAACAGLGVAYGLVWWRLDQDASGPARFALLGISYLAVFVYTGALGRATHVHMLVLPIAITGLGIFHPRRRGAQIASVLAPLGLMGALGAGAAEVVPRYPLSSEATSILAFLFDLTTALCALVVVALLTADSARHLDFLARRRKAERDSAEHQRRIDVANAAAEAAEARNRDLAQALDQLQVAKREIETANESVRRSAKLSALGQLSGGIAHDLNNMLMAIQNFVGFARESLPSGAEASSDLEYAEQAVARATRLGRRLLQFARRRPDDVRRVDCNALAASLREMLDRAVGPGISVALELAPSVPAIEVDPGHLEQVLVNLVLNARDAMPDGGTIVIRTRHDDDRVSIEVTDDGLGMTPEVRQRAFEPFFSTKGPERGTGLGLATCQAVVTEGGGDITVQSALGEGTTFTMRWPCAQGRPEAHDADSAHAVENRAVGRTVLLAEDDEIVRLTAQRVLERAGFSVMVAERGLDALALARERRPDVLLTDLVMPGMSGARLAVEVRRLHPGVGVILMTGCDEDEMARQGALFHSQNVLQKPVLPKRMIEAVLETLPVESAGGASDPARA